MGCEEIENTIKKFNFKITNKTEDNEKCIIDFKHPKVKVMKPVSYFLSSVEYKKDGSLLNTIVRSKVDDVKELYLDYCCENGEMACRPHIHMKESILSVDATFRQKPIEKFRNLLAEMI